MPIPSVRTPTVTDYEPEVEHEIMRTLQQNGRMSFTVLSELMSQYRWHELLSGLNRLRDRGCIDVASFRWDYVISRVVSQEHE